MRARSILGCLACLLAASCEANVPSAQSWFLEFEPVGLRGTATHVRAWVARDCTPGAPRVYEATFLEEEPASMPPDPLEPGRWAFGAEAINLGCEVFARGCVEVDIPDDMELITTTLTTLTPREGCWDDCDCVVRPVCDPGPFDFGTCPDGFADCVAGDPRCESVISYYWALDIGGVQNEGCGFATCNTRTWFQSDGTTCPCDGSEYCYGCERRDDGSLVAVAGAICASPDMETTDDVPTSTAGCSQLSGDGWVWNCCQPFP